MYIDPKIKELCLEIILGDVGSARFNDLLLETGISLDDGEWEATNKILSKSEEMFSLSEPVEAAVQ